MKVLQVLYSGLGGHGSVAFSLLGGDRDGDWEPVMVFVGIEPLLHEYVEKCKKKSTTFYYIAAKEGQPWRHWGALFRLLVSVSPDVVILHSTTSIIPVAFFTRLKKKILISVEHTPNHLKRAGERLMSRLAMFLSQRLIVLTDKYKHELSRTLGRGFKENKVCVVPNGVDTRLYQCTVVKQQSDIFRIGMAARLSSAKRQDVLVKAVKVLKKSVPNINWYLSIAGSGEEYGSLTNLVKKEGVGSRVELLGNLDEQALVRWFHSLNLYAHASEGETLSTSMLQAMSMSIPIIASDVPGIRNLLQSGPNERGLLVERNNPESFAAAIICIASDAKLVDRITGVSRTAVDDFYSQDVMFKSYNRVIDEII